MLTLFYYLTYRCLISALCKIFMYQSSIMVDRLLIYHPHQADPVRNESQRVFL